MLADRGGLVEVVEELDRQSLLFGLLVGMAKFSTEIKVPSLGRRN